MVKPWKDSVARFGDEARARIGRVMQTALKNVNKARQAVTSWWYGKKPTKKSSSTSTARRKSSSNSSSRKL